MSFYKTLKLYYANVDPHDYELFLINTCPKNQLINSNDIMVGDLCSENTSKIKLSLMSSWQ